MFTILLYLNNYDKTELLSKTSFSKKILKKSKYLLKSHLLCLPMWLRDFLCWLEFSLLNAPIYYCYPWIAWSCRGSVCKELILSIAGDMSFPTKSYVWCVSRWPMIVAGASLKTYFGLFCESIYCMRKLTRDACSTGATNWRGRLSRAALFVRFLHGNYWVPAAEPPN